MQSSWVITAPTSPPEAWSIALAAERADEAEIAKIRQCCNACADDIHNGSPHLQSHEAVCQAVETKIRMRLKRK